MLRRKVALRAQVMFSTLYLLSGFLEPALAGTGDTTAATSAGAVTSTATATGAAPAGTVLQGSATVTAGQAEAGVREAAEEVKRVRHAAADVITEVTRQEQVAVSEPDVIGPMVIPAIPAPSGMMGIGPSLPPRRKFLNTFVYQMAQFYNLAISEVQNLVVPESKQEAITAPWNQSKQILLDMSMHYNNLLALIQKDNLENDPIGKEALAIYDDTSAFNKPWKEIYKILKEKSK